MSSLHPQKELPNPFAEHDSNTDRLKQCEMLIAEQHDDIHLLRQCVITLMNLCNRKMANDEKKNP